MRILIVVLMCLMCGVGWGEEMKLNADTSEDLVFNGEPSPFDGQVFEPGNVTIVSNGCEHWCELSDAPEDEPYCYRIIKLEKKYINSVSVVDNGEQITIALHWRRK